MRWQRHRRVTVKLPLHGLLAVMNGVLQAADGHLHYERNREYGDLAGSRMRLSYGIPTSLHSVWNNIISAGAAACGDPLHNTITGLRGRRPLRHYNVTASQAGPARRNLCRGGSILPSDCSPTGSRSVPGMGIAVPSDTRKNKRNNTRQRTSSRVLFFACPIVLTSL